MISPNVNAALIRSCVGRGLVAMPGALTPSEAAVAWEAGAQFVKLFPAGFRGNGGESGVFAMLLTGLLRSIDTGASRAALSGLRRSTRGRRGRN